VTCQLALLRGTTRAKKSGDGDGETTVEPTVKNMLGSSVPKADAIDKARAKQPDAGPEHFSRSETGSVLMRAQFRILKEAFLKMKSAEVKGVKVRTGELSWKWLAYCTLPVTLQLQELSITSQILNGLRKTRPCRRSWRHGCRSISLGSTTRCAASLTRHEDPPGTSQVAGAAAKEGC